MEVGNGLAFFLMAQGLARKSIRVKRGPLGEEPARAFPWRSRLTVLQETAIGSAVHPSCPTQEVV